MLSERYAARQSMESIDKCPPYTVICRDNSLSLSRCFVCVVKKQADGHSGRGSVFSESASYTETKEPDCPRMYTE